MTDRPEPSPGPGRRRGQGQATTLAIVLRRSDFRETSRIVTCLSREHGRLSGLAKGAHRPDSPFLGRLDFLNEVEATFSADRGGLRLLVKATLRRERRALREPARFVAASHLAQLCEHASQEGQPAPELFDLLHGGLNLLERCPREVVAQVVLGLELRYLGLLGALPDLERCCVGGCALGEAAFREPDGRGLACRRHAGVPRRAVAAEVLASLRLLLAGPGRSLPSTLLPAPAHRAAPLVGAWLEAATEQRARLRPMLFEAGLP
jgi:DNA repair protein RecO (recombination protein O)